MAYEFIKFEVKDHVAYITLNNPQKKNPVPNPAKKELIRLFDICDFDDDIRLVVIRGAGGCFSAGGDLNAMRDRLERGERGTRYNCRLGSEMNLRLRNVKKPVIACIEGAIAGAGMSLALSCDFQIAAADTKCTLAFVNIGYVPDSGSMTAYNMEYGKVTVDGGYFRFGDGRTTWGHVGYADEITVLSGTFYYNPKFFTGHWGGGNATSVGHGRPIGKLTIYDGTTWTLTTMSMRNEKINNALGGTEEFYYVIDGVEHQISTDVNSDLDLTYLPVNEGSYLYLDDGSGRITKNVTINGGVLCMYTSGTVLDTVNLTGMNGFLQAGEGVTYNVVITDGAKYECYGNNVVTGVVVDGGGKRYEELDGRWMRLPVIRVTELS